MATSRILVLAWLGGCTQKEPSVTVTEAPVPPRDGSLMVPELQEQAEVSDATTTLEGAGGGIQALASKSVSQAPLEPDRQAVPQPKRRSAPEAEEVLDAGSVGSISHGDRSEMAVADAITGGRTARSKEATRPMPSAPPATITAAVRGSDPADDAVGWDSSSSREEYTDAGVNPFTIVSKDPLSTFSIDVDTASYSLMRRKVLGGELPAWQGVRPEEFINYFDYGYPSPKSDPFAVSMEAMPDPFRAGHHILRVGVQGREVPEAERPDVHLTFLVDVSGSMSSPDKLPLAQKSLHMLVDRLHENDTVALCTYAGGVARILEPTSASDRSAIHRGIDSLKSGGSTAMSSGIDLAYELADGSFERGAENRVIILSDGDANVGAASWEAMLGQIKGYADKGVTLTTVGFGTGNYRDTLMEQLANHGDGTNVYIDDASQAERVFVEQVSGTLLTIARDVKIQVEFNAESVSSYRLVGYENRDIADRDFRNDRVDAGEVGSGHNVTALYDVMLKDGYARELATVRLRYERPGADGTAMEKAFVFQDSSLKETAMLASRSTRIAYSAATFAEVLRQSPHANEISLERLREFASKAAREGVEDDRELVVLIERAAKLGTSHVASN
jgi:Ca-activated chloride channel homolog